MSIFAVLLGAFLLFVLMYAIRKMVDPTTTLEGFFADIVDWMKPTTAQNPVPIYTGYNPVYAQYQKDYENFSLIVLDCLSSIGEKCKLSIPADPRRIFAAEVDSRVALNGGICTFCYETSREESAFIGGMKQEPKFPAEEIARILRGNLPNSMRGGYYFAGSIDVWDIGGNRIRIEIHSVNRQLPNPNLGGNIL